MATDVELTVVVCTFNRAHKIERVLEALRMQSIFERLSILVVDDGSDDQTSAVLALHPWVRVVRHDHNRGLAAARNTALSVAHTGWVAFTDDDCLPEPDWAAQLLSVVQAFPDACAVGGPVFAEPGEGLVNRYLQWRSPFSPIELTLLHNKGFWHRLSEYLRRSSTTGSSHTTREVASVPGANMALRSQVALDLGGWDDTFSFGGEEEELFRRAHERGLAMIYGPGPRVVHNFDDTLRDVLRRSYRYGQGNARMHAKHGGLPTLYPAPFLVTAGLAGAVVSRRAPAIALIVPQLIFSVWPREARRQRRPDMLLFPYLQVLQEFASNVGWVQARFGACGRSRGSLPQVDTARGQSNLTPS